MAHLLSALLAALLLPFSPAPQCKLPIISLKNSYFEVLSIPTPTLLQNVTLFEHKVIADVISSIKMSSLGWVLILHVWCPDAKGKFRHRDMYTRRTSCEDKAEVVVMLLCQRLLLNHQNLGERLTQSLPHISQEKPALPMPWLWTSSVQNCKAIDFC